MNLIINNNLQLIPISLKFANEIHDSFTNEIIEFLPIDNVSEKLEDTIEFINISIQQKIDKTDYVWVIIHENKFAGVCGIHTIKSRQPHFGLWIKKEEQGKGIGKKLVNFILKWAISNLEIDFIKYPVDSRNIKSVRLIKDLNLELHHSYETVNIKKLKTDEYRLYKKKN